MISMRVSQVIAVILMFTSVQGIFGQQTQATYNLSSALESMTTAILTAQVSNLASVVSLQPLRPTRVQVEACQAGSFSLDDAQTCTLCSMGKYSGATTAVSSATCVSCGAGKYQNITGATREGQCQNCPPNTYFTGTSGESLSVCVPCPAFSGSFSGSGLLQSCVCSPGYSGPNGESCDTHPPHATRGTDCCAGGEQEGLARPATRQYGA